MSKIKLAILNLAVLLLFEYIGLAYIESRLDKTLDKVNYWNLYARSHVCKTKSIGIIINGTLVFKEGGSAENIEFITEENGLAIDAKAGKPVFIKNCMVRER